MNYTTLIVKVITKPIQRSVDNGISVIEFVGKFYQYRNNKYTVCKVSVWSNSLLDLNEFYSIKDYVIVEGHISIRESVFEDSKIKTSIEISTFKSYPLLMKPKKITK